MAPRSRRPSKASVKAAADRAEKRAKGEEVEPAVNPVLDPPVVKRPRGRPSDYDPAMCQTVLELGAAGKSKAQIAKELGVSRVTMTAWEGKHPEFLNAVKEAQDLALAWWEEKGQDSTFDNSKGFNATAFIFQMKNRFRDDYRDTQAHEHTGKDGASLIPSSNPRDLAAAILGIIREGQTSPVK